MSVFQDADAFTVHYAICAVWASHDSDGEPLDSKDLGFADIHPETARHMAVDCHRFQAENAALLEASGLTDEQAGHDFWLTRNHHGAGYWDRGLGEIGQALTDAAHRFGECDLYIGDDGLIHA